MNGLATEILKFFSEALNVSVEDDVSGLRTLDDFVNQDHHFETSNMVEIVAIINKLKGEGLLMSLGHKPTLADKYLFSELLASTRYSDSHAGYGTYEFIIKGFQSIANHFAKSVRPVIVTKNNGDLDIGTSFILGNEHNLVTARHVVEDVNLIQIPDTSGNPVKARSVVLPQDERIDIALIIVDDHAFKELPPFRGSTGKILEEVLTIGYPPIPGFDALQLFEIASINNTFKLSSGRLIGSSTSYLDGVDYLIINAKVKGGNSGSPVINREGYVVGMVVQIPFDSQDVTQIDKLGYGVVTPKSEIVKFFAGPNQSPVTELRVTNVRNGFQIIR